MHLAVTGSNGLVGSRVVRALTKKGHRVTALGRGSLRFVAPDASYVSVDLGDAAGLMACLEDAKPDVIVNCGGMTDVDGCEREPDAAYVANVEGVATLCRAAKKLGAHLLHVSTDYVFDGDHGPYDVDALPNPRGTYAITKHLGEQAVKALLPSERWGIARTAVVYGWPSAAKNNFGSWLVDTLRHGRKVKLFNDQWVSPTLALNLADMLAELAERRLAGIWHTCGADVVDRVTFGRKLCERFGFEASLIEPSKMSELKLASPRPAKAGLLVTKTLAELKSRPLPLVESLERFLREYREIT